MFAPEFRTKKALEINALRFVQQTEPRGLAAKILQNVDGLPPQSAIAWRNALAKRAAYSVSSR